MDVYQQTLQLKTELNCTHSTYSSCPEEKEYGCLGWKTEVFTGPART